MGFQIQKAEEKEIFLAVDIGTARIKVLLVQVDKGDFLILSSVSMRQSKKHMHQGEILDLQGVSDTLLKAIHKVEEEKWVTAKKIVYSVSSQFLITDTLSMNYVRASDTSPITMEEIDVMVSKLEHKSLEKIKPKILVQVPIEDTQMKLVTTTVTAISLDGKKVSNPIGFTGKNMSLTVCNVFVPQSTFHVYSAIARKIDKEVVSFVPAPMILPKAQGDALELFDPNCYVDIGYSLTTIVLENFSEILGAMQIPIGVSVFENMLIRKFPKLSRLEIEHCMHHPEIDTKDQAQIRAEFMKVLLEAIFVALRNISTSYVLRNMYVSGWITTQTFQDEFQKYTGDFFTQWSLKILSLPLSDGLSPDYGVVYSAARATQELLRQSRDPIAKILRYVIYKYE
jgi:hypothetical protein